MNIGESEKFKCDVEFEEEIDLNDLSNKIKGIDKENSNKFSLLSGAILFNAHGHTFWKYFDREHYIFNQKIKFWKNKKFENIFIIL